MNFELEDNFITKQKTEYSFSIIKTFRKTTFWIKKRYPNYSKNLILRIFERGHQTRNPTRKLGYSIKIEQRSPRNNLLRSSGPDEDTGDGRATTHQFYSSAKEVWYSPMMELSECIVKDKPVKFRGL